MELKEALNEELKEAGNTYMKTIAESALKGPNMATRESVIKTVVEEKRLKEKGGVEYD